MSDKALPLRQQKAYDYFCRAIPQVPGVMGVQLKGSLSTGGDTWSDLDLQVLTQAVDQDQVMAACLEIVKAYKTVLWLETVNFGQPQIVCIFEDHLHVDLYIGPGIETKPKLPQVLSAINNALYTFHELDIALKRADHLWALRLISHILADLSLALDFLNQPNKDFLHLKNLEQHLPKAVTLKMLEIYQYMGVRDYTRCFKALIAFTQDLLAGLPEYIRQALNTTFFDYFSSWPDRFGGYYASLETLPFAQLKDWTLKGAGISLRPLDHKDAKDLITLLNSEGWLKFIGDRQVKSLEEAHVYIDRILSMPRGSYWVIASDKADFLGVITLLHREHLPLPDLGFALVDSAKGKGLAYLGCRLLMAEVKQLDAYRGLMGICMPENIASQKLLIKLGFEPIGLECQEDCLVRYQII